MRKRFFRAATISIIAGLVVAFLFAVPLMLQVYTDEMERQLESVLVLAQDAQTEAEDYQSMASRVGKQMEDAGLDIRLTVLDGSGTVLGDSSANPSEMENHADRPEVREALENGQGQDIRQSETSGTKQLYRAVRVERPNGAVLVYRASVPMDGYTKVQTTLWLCGGVGIFMGLVAALIAASYSAGRVVEPLQSLTQAARAVAAGESDVHVESAPDEMGELAGAFNKMSRRLTEAHQELEHSNQRLAGILQGMDDGVVAIDAEERIVLMTHRVRELLGDCPATVRRLSECGADYLYIDDLLHRVLTQGGSLRDTRMLAGRDSIVQVYAARVSDTGEGGALAVISDVTRIRKLEQMRSDFVANVTHELKTPLTSIRGYIELLKSGKRDEETARSFYEIIEIEAERLQKLTDDLLQLSEIENGGAEAEVPFSLLRETISRVEETLKPEAASKGVVIHTFIEPSLQVQAHPRRLYQLMKNLMENGVKYNRTGGALNVSARMEMGVAVIRVHDTGIGIPPEHLERVFERFYRVDKGRSREMGGTGLGLSIVKHIVSLYGGDIRVDSETGVGTTFTVRLPGRAG